MKRKVPARKWFPITGWVGLCISFALLPPALEAGSRWESAAKKEKGCIVWYAS